MVPIWYNGFTSSARSFRALRPMGARRAVLLTPSESIHPTQLLSCQHIAPITPLESALVEVFILKSLKFFRINTYEKHRGEGVPPLLPTCPTRNAQKHFAHLLFFSTACAMPLSQLLSFDNHPFSWGVYPPVSAIIPPRIPGEAQ